jgi:hypothetical protein
MHSAERHEEFSEWSHKDELALIIVKGTSFNTPWADEQPENIVTPPWLKLCKQTEQSHMCKECQCHKGISSPRGRWIRCPLPQPTPKPEILTHVILYFVADLCFHRGPSSQEERRAKP